MARNKHPEQTVQRILTVAGKLFSEKGYDGTSMQDIVSALGMSKGAIYHHFKSKQEILERLSEAFKGEEAIYLRLKNDRSLTGLQKLYRFFCYAVSDREKQAVNSVLLLGMGDPQVIARVLHNATHEAAGYLGAFLEEGMRDGSMTVRHPAEAAQAILLLLNLWLNPGMEQGGRERYREKLCFMKELTDGIGIPLMDEPLILLFCDYYDRLADVRAKASRD